MYRCEAASLAGFVQQLAVSYWADTLDLPGAFLPFWQKPGLTGTADSANRACQPTRGVRFRTPWHTPYWGRFRRKSLFLGRCSTDDKGLREKPPPIRGVPGGA